MIEHILSLTVRLQVERHDGGDRPVFVFDAQVMGRPPCPRTGAAALFEDVEKVVVDEWVCGRCGDLRTGVPGPASDL
jgi:ribosomal protein S27AE